MKALILAGGHSKRMGRDKATIERPDGTRQLDHLIALARSLDLEVLLSTTTPETAPAGLPVLADLHPGSGPLAALEAFNDAHPGEPVLLLGCDLYLLDPATLRQLIDRHDPARPATAFANRIDHRPEPLCTVYGTAAIAMAPAAIAAGQFCARHFLESLEPQILELPNPVALDSANTAAELDECFAKLTGTVEPKTVRVLYFAKLREARGLDEESVRTLACTAAGLFEELRFRHRLPMDIASLSCARNGNFCPWSEPIATGDEIIFLPPFAGG